MKKTELKKELETVKQTLEDYKFLLRDKQEKYQGLQYMLHGYSSRIDELVDENKMLRKTLLRKFRNVC